jgi:hypothetical protein
MFLWSQIATAPSDWLQIATTLLGSSSFLLLFAIFLNFILACKNTKFPAYFSNEPKKVSVNDSKGKSTQKDCLATPHSQSENRLLCTLFFKVTKVQYL